MSLNAAHSDDDCTQRLHSIRKGTMGAERDRTQRLVNECMPAARGFLSFHRCALLDLAQHMSSNYPHEAPKLCRVVDICLY